MKLIKKEKRSKRKYNELDLLHGTLPKYHLKIQSKISQERERDSK